MALDESPDADVVTNMLIAQMKTIEVEMRLLHVVDPFPMKLGETIGSREYPDLAAARVEQ